MDLISCVENFCKSHPEYSFTVRFHEPIAEKTTFKIGGTSLVFCEPNNLNSFCGFLEFLIIKKIKYFVLGGGSNIVFCDNEFPGIVLSTGKLNSVCIEDSSDSSVFVRCFAGSPFSKLVRFALENDLWGLQEFSGLPGSVGGAVFMNARCFEKEISDVFESAEYFDIETLSLKKISFWLSDWQYKKSPFQNQNRIILSSVFRLSKKTSLFHEDLVNENRKFVSMRKEKGHFSFPSAGSVFKNNRDFHFPAGKIIDDCGLKGKKCGNAQIAPFHGNFIINLGGATQSDVKNLVQSVKDEVLKNKGFLLEPEIIFVE